MIPGRVRAFPILCIAVSLAFCLAGRQALALIEDFTPLSRTDLSAKFKLKEVVDSHPALRDGITLKLAGCQLKIGDRGDLLVSGKDLANKPFQVALHFYGMGTFVFTGDLDKNGREDIVIAGATGACGLAPSMIFDAVLFDKKGRPSLWGVTGYGGEETKLGRCDLMRLGNDPRAVKIQEKFVYRTVGKRTLTYWRTLLYRAENGGWRLLPQYRGHATPLLVRFRFNSNHDLVKTIPGDLREFPNVSTLGPNGRGMKEVVIREIKYDEQGKVDSIDFGSGYVPIGWSDRYYGTTIYRDTDALFSAAYLSTDLATELLKEAANNKSRIKVPAASWAGCLPWEMWIVESK